MHLFCSLDSSYFCFNLCRIKLFRVFQGLREEGFEVSSSLATEFLKRCHKVSLREESPGRQIIQKILKTGMSLGKVTPG